MSEPALLDTSALLYWTLDPARLSERAATYLGEHEERWVCSISLWEIALKAKRGALELPTTIESYLDRLRRARGLSVIELDGAVAVAAARLEWEHRDPADRFIVALAMEHDLSLVTSDARIRHFYSKCVW